MKVYLDNCILVDIEKGKLSLSDFCQIRGTEYFFSFAHMDELCRGLTNNPDLKEKRLSTISLLCGENFIVQDLQGQSIEFERKSAETAFSICKYFRTLADLTERVVAKCNPNRDGIIAELSLKKIEIGNVEPNEILELIDSQMRRSPNNLGLEDFLRLSEAYTLKAKYSTLFNLLDSVFYWKDEHNVNRLYDSSHACHAQFCDILVTNDRRMAIKAKAIYAYWGLKTQVMNSDEYLRLFMMEDTSAC